MPTWMSKIAEFLFYNPEGGLADDFEHWDNRRLMFDTMHEGSSVVGALDEVVVYTVSGDRFRGRLTVHGVSEPTVWVDQETPDRDVSVEIAKRHIVAIEYVIPKQSEPGSGGVADGE